MFGGSGAVPARSPGRPRALPRLEQRPRANAEGLEPRAALLGGVDVRVVAVGGTGVGPALRRLGDRAADFNQPPEHAVGIVLGRAKESKKVAIVSR